jgi:hypothetical protein
MNLARVACVAAVVCLTAGAVSAHDRKIAGRFVLTIGWEDEPALAGFKNAIDVAVADAAGAPVVDPVASLTVDVSFGSDRVTLPLRPAGRQPGRYRAPLIPTRAGTYTFRVAGMVGAQPIELSSSCSDTTFECVADAADLQFPARDPTTGQLAERIGRGLPRVEAAAGRASSARLVALAAIAIAAAALVVAWIGRGSAAPAPRNDSSRA